MGDELRHDKRGDTSSQAGEASPGLARARQDEVSSVKDLGARSESGLRERDATTRVSRPSIRPSAFGIPRASFPRSSAPGVSSLPPKRESVPPAAGPRPSMDGAPPARMVQPVRRRPPASAAPPAIKTDIEELLPITQGVKSLPRPPRMPSFDTPQLPLAAARRFPWASLVVFVVMLLSSFAPLSRYRGERSESQAMQEEQRALLARDEDERASGATGAEGAASRPLAPAALSAVDRIERGLWGEPARVREALLQEAERALLQGDELLAEPLFARALEFDGDFDGDDARAEYGMARARLAQNDLKAAERFALAAISKRPRRTEYRALHAEILQRAGRGAEAQMERVVVRALAHFSGGTRGR